MFNLGDGKEEIWTRLEPSNHSIRGDSDEEVDEGLAKLRKRYGESAVTELERTLKPLATGNRKIVVAMVKINIH